jgi:hypothetical protein
MDFGALRDAVESGNLDALLGFYAEEAELRVVDAARPRGAAFELEGRAEIGKYLRTVRDGGTSIAFNGGAVSNDRGIAFVEECRYPDGAQVSVETMLEVEEGLIVRQVDVVSAEPAQRRER